MRKPKLNDFDEDDGNGPDYEAYCDMMDHYADEQRDDMIDREMEKQQEDQDEMNGSCVQGKC